MASSNKDNSIEYDKQMYKKPERPKNHLAGRLNKFQETINQTQAPSAPVIQSIHEYVLSHDVDVTLTRMLLLFSVNMKYLRM